MYIETTEKFNDRRTKAIAAMDENLKVLDEQLQQQSMCLEISSVTSCAVASALFVVTMKFWPPVDLKPLKILKPKLDWMITSWTPTTLPIFVEIGPTGSAPRNAEI